jgi:murein endopeptidase
MAAVVLGASAGRRAPRAQAGEVLVGGAVLAEIVPIPPAPPLETFPRCAPEPLLSISSVDPPPDADLARVAREDPGRLGSASIGSPTRGGLWGGVELTESDGITRAGGYPWGTRMAIASIERAVREVRRCFPDTPKLFVGDISRKDGGWLRPHRSHQSGLDADLGYYYRTEPSWFLAATKDNLDVPRTWALVRALYDAGNVDAIFMDRSIQDLLRAHAETHPEGRAPPPDFFQSAKKKDAVVRHVHGHRTHLHVRFRDPVAVDLGSKLARVLPRWRRP